METSLPPAFSTEAFDADLEEPVVMPVTAWLSLGFSLLGVLAIGLVQTAILPLIGILLGLVGLRRRTGFKLHPVGSFVARAGIILGCLFFASAATAHYLHWKHLSDEGEQFARAWLQVMEQGKFAYATQLTQARNARQLPGVDLDKYYAESEPEIQDRLRSISSANWVTDVQVGALAGKKPTWVLATRPKVTRFYETYRVDLEFRDANGVVKEPVKVSLKRDIDPFLHTAEWHIAHNE